MDTTPQGGFIIQARMITSFQNEVNFPIFKHG